MSGRILTDRDIIAQTMLDLAETHTLWRNNTGALQDKRGRLVRFGLHPGSSDLIGFQVCGGLDGYDRAIFTAIECKSARDRLSDAQRTFLSHVSRSGGIAQVAQADKQGRITLTDYQD